jgi:hypothetical protein
MKIRPVGASLFQTDGRTDNADMTKLTVAFRNFANAPKKIDYFVTGISTQFPFTFFSQRRMTNFDHIRQYHRRIFLSIFQLSFPVQNKQQQ